MFIIFLNKWGFLCHVNEHVTCGSVEASLKGCWQDEDVFLWLIAPHGAVLRAPPNPNDGCCQRRTQTEPTLGKSLHLSPALLFLKVWKLPQLQKGGHVSSDDAIWRGRKRDRIGPSSLYHWKVWYKASQHRCPALRHTSKRINLIFGRELEKCHVLKFDLCREGCWICELRGGKISGYTTVQATRLPGTAFRAGLQALVCRGRRHFS